MTAHNRPTDIAQHVVIENAALGTADQNRSTFIRSVAAAILQTFKAHTIENRLQVAHLLRGQLRANPVKNRI